MISGLPRINFHQPLIWTTNSVSDFLHFLGIFLACIGVKMVEVCFVFAHFTDKSGLLCLHCFHRYSLRIKTLERTFNLLQSD